MYGTVTYHLFSLTEELLASTTEESTKTLRDMLFARLAPLLVLKVVPFKYFDLPSDTDESPLVQATSTVSWLLGSSGFVDH